MGAGECLSIFYAYLIWNILDGKSSGEQFILAVKWLAKRRLLTNKYTGKSGGRCFNDGAIFLSNELLNS